MEQRKLRIGIACFPLIGGSGILATALGTEWQHAGTRSNFLVTVARCDSICRYPASISIASSGAPHAFPLSGLHTAAGRDDVGSGQQIWARCFSRPLRGPHAIAACLAAEMCAPRAPRIVDDAPRHRFTLLGQDPAYQTAIEFALARSEAVAAVSASLRAQTHEILKVSREIQVIYNFFVPCSFERSRAEVRAQLGLDDEFLILHMSNMRPGKRIDLY